MNRPYRVADPRPPYEIERPFFPHIGDLVRIGTVTNPFSTSGVPYALRVGEVFDILAGAYCVQFHDSLIPSFGIFFAREIFRP